MRSILPRLSRQIAPTELACSNVQSGLQQARVLLFAHPLIDLAPASVDGSKAASSGRVKSGQSRLRPRRVDHYRVASS